MHRRDDREKLARLGYSTGGDLPVTSDGSTPDSFAIGAAREYIVGALTDGQPWGTDPMFKGATCTYAYRSFDQKAVKKLADRFKVQSSGLFYVNAAQPVLKAAATVMEALMTKPPVTRDQLANLSRDNITDSHAVTDVFGVRPLSFDQMLAKIYRK